LVKLYGSPKDGWLKYRDGEKSRYF